MMDFREATKTLDAYSTSILSKTSFCDKLLNPHTREEKDVIEKMIAALKVETKEAMVILTLVLEEVTMHHEQIVIGFTGELTDLIEAVNRSQAATAEARMATRAHEEKSQTEESKESPSAKAVREFCANRGRSN
jgi:DNA polymerase III delta prime subunit